jgi:hypothetical protein
MLHVGPKPPPKAAATGHGHTVRTGGGDGHRGVACGWAEKVRRLSFNHLEVDVPQHGKYRATMRLAPILRSRTERQCYVAGSRTWMLEIGTLTAAGRAPRRLPEKVT